MTRSFLKSRSGRRSFTFGTVVIMLFFASFDAVVRTQGGQAPAAPPAAAGGPRGSRGAGGAPQGPGGAGGRGAANSELADFSPKAPYLPRTAAEEAKTFMLPAGYRL